MNRTTNYQLCQWAAADRVLRTDFNADNAKIDAAIKAQADAIAAEVSDRKSVVSTINNTLAGKGNCQIASGTYTGDGVYGTKYTNLHFSFQPKLVIIQNTAAAQFDVTKSSDQPHFMLVLVRPLTEFYLYQGMAQVTVSWGSSSVAWKTDYGARAQMNDSGLKYTYVAFG